MSFKCQNCNKVQPEGTKPTKIVTEVRAVTYPPVEFYGKVKIPTGYETVKELNMCPACASREGVIKTVGGKVIEEKED